MRRFLDKARDMPVQDYIASVIEINNYLKEFLPVIAGGNATKLPCEKILELLEFRIPSSDSSKCKFRISSQPPELYATSKTSVNV